jgi:hypothetical protein
MDVAHANQLLGINQGSIKGKSDLEKVRQRSKDLYKRYASEKEEKKAKRVLEAFEVIKNQFKKQEGAKGHSTGNSSASATAKKPDPNAARKPDAQMSRKPDANASVASRRSTTSGGAAAVEAKHGEIQKQLAAIRHQFDDNTASKPGAHKSVSKPGSSSRPTSSSQGRKPDQVKVMRVNVSEAGVKGTSSTIRSSSNGTLTLMAKKPDPSAASNGKVKRASSQDIPFAASKRNCVVAAMPAPNGTDKSVRLICKCGANYGANRFQGATGSFKCPGCRVRAMDPLNVVLKGSKGMLSLKLVQKPLVPEEAKLEATFRFKIDVSKIKEWRKLGHNVECRMCRLDTYNPYQCWPHSMTVKVNSKPAFSIKEPKPGHKRRDLPHRVSANLKPGVNVFEVNLKDQDVQRYALALVRTAPLIPRDMCKSVTCLGMEDCKQRVTELLFSSMLEGCVEEFQATASDRSRLVCPISLDRMKTPVRGKKCKHLQSFDLEAYLVANQKMAVINKRWLCPVCNLVVKPPGDLFIDTLLVSVLAETGELDEEVAFDNTASWTVTSVAEPPSEDSEDAFEPPAAVPVQQEIADDVSSDDAVAVANEQPGSPDHSDIEPADATNDADGDGAVAEDCDGDEGNAANTCEGECDDNDVGQEQEDDEQNIDLKSPDGVQDDVCRTYTQMNVSLDDEQNIDLKSPDANGEPEGSPSASSPANAGSASPIEGSDAEPQTDPYVQTETDPYMLVAKEDDDVDEDFVATLRETPADDAVEHETFGKPIRKNGSNGHTRKPSFSMIATPAPLASPTPGMTGSPGEASDPDDPLGLDKLRAKTPMVVDLEDV